jgi:hypothetical protein
MDSNEVMPDLMTRREVSRHLRVAHETLRQLIRTPKLQILAQSEVRIGRQIVYPKTAVMAFLAAASGQK